MTPTTRQALRDCIGAIEALAEQVGQMKGMFPDDDGTISEAEDAGLEAVQAATAVLTPEQPTTAASPIPPGFQTPPVMDAVFILTSQRDDLVKAMNELLANPNDPRCWARGRRAVAMATESA